jgi:hypothetical protein
MDLRLFLRHLEISRPVCQSLFRHAAEGGHFEHFLLSSDGRNAENLGYMYRGADKSLARPGRKQATATEDFDFHISYL